MTVSDVDVCKLSDVTVSISGDELAAELVPPRQFASASFDSYRPDKDFPSQADAVTTLRSFVSSWNPTRQGGLFSWRRKRTEPTSPGLYLDGGFGVGKTHLLAATWHEASQPKYFGTFIEYTALVGALGFSGAVDLLRGAELVCIDEFELDDPGDTMMMTRLLAKLVDGGTRVAATSNTPPNALGEGRFAAADFLREIQSLATVFDTVRIDGLDYRRRSLTERAQAVAAAELERAVAALRERRRQVSVDDFGELVRHLGSLHPSTYRKLVRDLDVIALTDVYELHDQTDALRWVALIDRIYDAEIPIIASGVPLDAVFDEEMLAGGYRKKYLRGASRMLALTTGDLPTDS